MGPENVRQLRVALLGHPGRHWVLGWYQDRTLDLLPTAWVVSIPLLAYRVLMLAWALWLAPPS